MRIRYDLWICGLLMWGAAFGAAFSFVNAVRLPLGLLAVLVVPGYLLQVIVFPRRQELGGWLRFGFSVGFSLAVVIIIGLVLNYVGGIQQATVILSLTGFGMLAIWAGWWRRMYLEKNQIFYPVLPLPRRQRADKFDEKVDNPNRRTQRTARIVLSVVLVCAAELALLILVLLVVNPSKDNLTEFYLLDAVSRKPANYPATAKAGEPVEVLLGVANNEEQAQEYRVEILVDGQPSGEAGPWRVMQNGRLELKLSFVPPSPSPAAQVLFRLYRMGDNAPYRSLRLIIEVK